MVGEEVGVVCGLHFKAGFLFCTNGSDRKGPEV